MTEYALTTSRQITRKSYIIWIGNQTTIKDLIWSKYRIWLVNLCTRIPDHDAIKHCWTLLLHLQWIKHVFCIYTRTYRQIAVFCSSADSFAVFSIVCRGEMSDSYLGRTLKQYVQLIKEWVHRQYLSTILYQFISQRFIMCRMDDAATSRGFGIDGNSLMIFVKIHWLKTTNLQQKCSKRFLLCHRDKEIMPFLQCNHEQQKS